MEENIEELTKKAEQGDIEAISNFEKIKTEKKGDK